MPRMVVQERKSKEVRREEILDAAVTVFAEKGLHGASTEEIAKRAGISQPYVFRLFGTKKELYMAVVARCFRQTLEIFQRAAEGKRGQEAMNAIGLAYGELLETNRTFLRAQMQAYVIQVDDRDRILAELRAQGIEAQIGTYSLPLLGAYRDQGELPGARRLFERALALPFATTMTEDECDRVADALSRFV